MRTLKEQLIDVVDAFAAAKGLSDSRISTMVFGDGKIVGRLRGTGDLTTRRYEAALTWFSENWPEGAIWPEGVRLVLTPERLDALLEPETAA